MATIPVYPVGGAVNAAPLPNVRQSSIASPALFAGQRLAEQAGEGLSRAGAGLGDIQRRMQEREDMDAVVRAESELINKVTDFSLKARERRGQNAYGLTDEASKWFDEESRRMADGLGNDTQRRAFQNIALRRQASFRTGVAELELVERNKSLSESMAAAREAGVSAVAADPRLADAERDRLIKNIDSEAALRGWTPEITARARTENLTKLHTAAIGNLVEQSPEAAKEYYYKHRDEIDGAVQQKVTTLLDTAGREAKVQGVADEIERMGLDDEAAIKFIQDNHAGDDEKAIKQEWRTRRADRNAAEAARTKEVESEAWKVIAGGGGKKQIPVNLWNDLDGQTRTQINDYLYQRAKRAESDAQGKAMKTDITAYARLRDAVTADPEMATGSLLAMPEFSRLSSGDQQEMLKFRDSLRKDENRIKEVRTTDNQIANTVGLMELKGEAAAAFKIGTLREIDAETAARGKALNADERQKIIDRMLVEGDVNGAWPGGGRRWYEVAGTPQAEEFRAEVPDSERGKIVEALRRANKEVTEEAVQSLYRKKVGL